MAAPRRWIRVDVGWSRSEWLAELEPAARLAWIELLTYTKTDGIAGTVRPLSPAVFGRLAGIDRSDVEAMLEAAERDGALIIDEKSWTVANWGGYQETDPTAKERQRKHRADKSRLSPLRKDTRDTRNAPVTNGVTRHATETETETVQKTDARAQRAVAPNEAFEALWKERPRREGPDPKKRARHAWNARIREGIQAETISSALARYRKYCEAAGKIGTPYVMQAATFLGDPENFSNPWPANGNGGKPGDKTARTEDWEYRQRLPYEDPS